MAGERLVGWWWERGVGGCNGGWYGGRKGRIRGHEAITNLLR